MEIADEFKSLTGNRRSRPPVFFGSGIAVTQEKFSTKQTIHFAYIPELNFSKYPLKHYFFNQKRDFDSLPFFSFN